MKSSLLLTTLALLLAQCHHASPDPTPAPVDPLSQLPPATQTGARTFGCLVNGQAWTPAGNAFAGPLLTISYLSNELIVSASHYTANAQVTNFQRISFSAGNISAVGTYTLNDSSRFGTYENFDTSCTLITSATQPGTVTITKLDKVNRIVSGTFAFTLEQAGCGKIAVTNGRFDMPL